MYCRPVISTAWGWCFMSYFAAGSRFPGLPRTYCFTRSIRRLPRPVLLPLASHAHWLLSASKPWRNGLERRYSDCQHLADDLRRWLRGETPRAYRRTWAQLRG